MNNALVVVGYVAITATGAAVATAVLLDRRLIRWSVAALIGLMAVLLAASSLDHSTPDIPNEWAVSSIALAGAVVGILISLFSGWVLRKWTFIRAPKMRGWLRSEIITQTWTDVIDFAPAPTRDLVARWYVTIAASAGSIAGFLMCNREFWEGAAKTFSPSHIAATVIVAVISLSLIGPMEEIIRRQRLSPQMESEESKGDILTDFWENFSLRALGRVLLVGIVILQLTVFHSVLDETVSKGEAIKTWELVVTAMTPAIITYFWSAALQHGAVSVTRRSFRSATLFDAIIFWPAAVLCSFALCLFIPLLIWQGFIGTPPQFLFMIFFVVAMVVGWFLSGPLSILICGMTTGVAAAVGGWVLDRARFDPHFRGWRGLAYIGAGLTALSWGVPALLAIMWLCSAKSTRGAFDYQSWIQGLMIAFGWMAGLALSGFPKILIGSLAKADYPPIPLVPPDIALMFEKARAQFKSSSVKPTLKPIAPKPRLLPISARAPLTPEQRSQNKSEDFKVGLFVFAILVAAGLVQHFQTAMREVQSSGPRSHRDLVSDFKASLPIVWNQYKKTTTRPSTGHALSSSVFGDTLSNRSRYSLWSMEISSLGAKVDLQARQVRVYDDSTKQYRYRYGLSVDTPSNPIISGFYLKPFDIIVAVDNTWVTDDIAANRDLLAPNGGIRSIAVVRNFGSKIEVLMPHPMIVPQLLAPIHPSFKDAPVVENGGSNQ